MKFKLLKLLFTMCCKDTLKRLKKQIIISFLFIKLYCCPVKLKKYLNPSPKPNIYGLRGICYQK